MTSKKYFLTLIFLASLVMLLPALFVVLVDPFQIYHKHFLLEPKFSGNQRYQAAGFINSWLDESYDSVIVGTSLTENTFACDAAEIMSFDKTMKLTVNASTALVPLEHERVLRHALAARPELKDVVWEMHVSFTWSREKHYNWMEADEDSDEASYFPEYLYDDNLLNDYRYVFNEVSIFNAYDLLLGRQDPKDWKEALWEANYWMDAHRFERTNGFLKYSKPKQLDKQRKEVEEHRKEFDWTADLNSRRVNKYQMIVIDRSILPIIQQYRDKQFHLFLPPMPAYFFATTSQRYLENYASFRRKLIDKLSDEPNVKIYGFENEHWLVNNTAFYKDRYHYNDEINRYILFAMAQDRYRLNRENIEEYIQVLANNIRDYQVYSGPMTPYWEVLGIEQPAPVSCHLE